MAAEVVGLAVGAASLLTLFNTCVDIFRQVEVVCHFGDEFGRCRDAFLAEQHRLAEWRELLDIYIRDQQRPPTERDLEAIYVPLRRLEMLLKDVDDLFVSYDPKILDSKAQHQNRQTSLCKKAKFAVADLSKFNNLLENIATFRGHLDSATRHLIATSCNPHTSHIGPHQQLQVIDWPSGGGIHLPRLKRVPSSSTARSAPAILDPPSPAAGLQTLSLQPRRHTFTSSSAAAAALPQLSSRNRYDNLVRGSTCVSSLVDGTRAAFLTPHGVCLFDTSSALTGAPRLAELPRYEPSGAEWTGVALAGPCLAVWGPSSAGTGLLVHVASPSDSSPHAEYQESFHFTTKSAKALGGEQEPRIVVSRRGVVAFSNVRRVIVRSKAGGNIALPFPSPPQKGKQRILDIAISGDFLYCWVMHHPGPTQACLVSWNLSDPTRPQFTAEVKYNCNVGQNIHEATLYPYSSGRGCIVGHSARTIFFPCTWPGVQTKPKRGKECEELKRSASEIRAACVLGNSSMLVVRNPNKTDLVLYQYSILHGAIGKADIKDGLKLRLDARIVGKLAISAFEDPFGGGGTVVVAASNGSIEMVKL